MSEAQDTSPVPVTYDQVTLRRLQNGDYLRILLQRYGQEFLVQLGNVSPDGATYEWRWELTLSPAGLAELALDVNYALLLAARGAEGASAALQATLVDAGARLDAERALNAELEAELRALRPDTVLDPVKEG
jgi:hypothetical protein